MKEIFKRLLALAGYSIHKNNVFTDSHVRLTLIVKRMVPDLIIDVGANRGQFLCKYRRALGDLPVIAIEPIELHNSMLRALPYSNIKAIINACVSPDAEEATLHISQNDVCSSTLPLASDAVEYAPTAKYVSAIKVPTIRLDEVIRRNASGYQKIFLKIDTQGAEDRVLDTIGNAITQIAAIHIEVSLWPMYQGQKLWMDIINHVCIRDFQLVDVGVVSANPRTGVVLQLDLMFARKGLCVVE